MNTNDNPDPADQDLASAVDSPLDHKAVVMATNNAPSGQSPHDALDIALAGDLNTAVASGLSDGASHDDISMSDFNAWAEQELIAKSAKQMCGGDAQAKQVSGEDVQINAPNADFPDVPSVPDLTEEKLQRIPQIKEVLDVYVDGYDVPGVTMKSQLERARALGLMLLQYYFPVNQNFTVEPTGFDTMAAYGWSVRQTKPRNVKMEDWAPSEYRFIPRYNIAGFVVYKTYSVSEKGHQAERAVKFPHTYLAIIADHPKHAALLDRPEQHPKPTRPDIMAYDLGVTAKIQTGT
jgi:hypothetical protein